MADNEKTLLELETNNADASIEEEPVSQDLQEDDEEITAELLQALIDEFDAIHARLDNSESKVNSLISAVSSLVEVLKGRAEVSSATEDDVNDMMLVIKGQREIINAIITIPELDNSIRKTIAQHLMSLSSWETMEAAQKRLHRPNLCAVHRTWFARALHTPCELCPRLRACGRP